MLGAPQKPETHAAAAGSRRVAGTSDIEAREPRALLRSWRYWLWRSGSPVAPTTMPSSWHARPAVMSTGRWPSITTPNRAQDRRAPQQNRGRPSPSCAVRYRSRPSRRARHLNGRRSWPLSRRARECPNRTSSTRSRLNAPPHPQTASCRLLPPLRPRLEIFDRASRWFSAPRTCRSH